MSRYSSILSSKERMVSYDCMQVYTRLKVHMYVCLDMCVYIRMYTCMCVYSIRYLHMHIILYTRRKVHVHVHVHVHV